MKTLLTKGFNVVVSSFLPVDEVVPASDIETKAVISIATGKMIHVIENNGELIVSREVYNRLIE